MVRCHIAGELATPNGRRVNCWASPVVQVLKKDGRVRICGDFKVTLNSFLQVDQYPMPKFSKIDLRQAYLQLPMDEESVKLLAINTHKGLYQVTRLPFGVASSLAIWQCTIDQILQGLEGVQCKNDRSWVTFSGFFTFKIASILSCDFP
jgi:hypothetical protein